MVDLEAGERLFQEGDDPGTAFLVESGVIEVKTRHLNREVVLSLLGPGDLVGEIEIPMKVGTVGGSLETNPSVRINHRLLGSPNAVELAAVMATVGLAQNFAALRALSTDGIQQNHMTLHARSVASVANVPEEFFDSVVEALIESGEIKVWKAQEILANLVRKVSLPESAERSSACA